MPVQPNDNPAPESTTRREFLQHSAAASAAVAVTAGAVNAADEKKPAKETSLAGRIYKATKGGRKKGETALAFAERMTKLGFHGVESGPANERAEIYEAFVKTGFRVHGLVNGGHWGVRLSDPNEDTRAKAVQNLTNAVKHSHAVGGDSVLLVPGVVKGASETHDDVWHRSSDGIKQVLPLAAKLGVRILIETVWNGFCYDPEKFRDYIDSFNHPWLGAYYDIGNMQKFAPAHEWIRILGSRNVKLDVKDWGKKNGFCRLGEGDVDWDKCREELKKLNFTGWATREGRDKDIEDTSKLMDQLLLGI